MKNHDIFKRELKLLLNKFGVQLHTQPNERSLSIFSSEVFENLDFDMIASFALECGNEGELNFGGSIDGGD